MVQQFYVDLERGKQAEKIVLATLENRYSEYKFYDVSDVVNCRHRGDIIATNAAGEKIFIEVKDDSRIADTHNVLCEECNWFEDISAFVDGNMHSQYELYAVLSRAEGVIYLIDFSVMKKIYKDKGIYKIIPHKGQTCYCYLLPLGEIEEAGGLIRVISL